MNKYKSSKELKRLARELLNNNYTIPMSALVLSSLITFAVGLPFSMLQPEHPTTIQYITFYLAQFLITLLSTVLSVGQLQIYLNIARKKPCEIKQLIWGFQNHPDRILLAGLLLSLIALIACAPALIGLALFLYAQTTGSIVLLVVLSLISMALAVFVDLSFQLLYYVLADHPELSAIECMRLSLKLIKGHKGRLFYLYLSFLGMGLLVVLSLGLGSLWIRPYQTQTYTLFYLDVIQEEANSTDNL